MGTDRIFQLIVAAIVVLGYGGVLIGYMLWGPSEANRALDALLGALSSGYLIVLTGLFKKE